MHAWQKVGLLFRVDELLAVVSCEPHYPNTEKFNNSAVTLDPLKPIVCLGEADQSEIGAPPTCTDLLDAAAAGTAASPVSRQGRLKLNRNSYPDIYCMSIIAGVSNL